MPRIKQNNFEWLLNRLRLITDSEIYKKINDGSSYVTTFTTGEWTIIKELFLAYYAPTYIRILKNRKKVLNYVDLFAGSGVIRLKEVDLNFPGSPLIIKFLIKESFTNYFFVDNDSNKLLQLQELLKDTNQNCKFIENDANLAITDLINEIGNNDMHSLVFIDPFAMEINFDTIRALSNVNCDIIITFASEQISRAIHQWLKNPQWNTNKLDIFYGDKDWKGDIDKNNVEVSAIKAYMNRLINVAKKRNPYTFKIEKTLDGHHYYILFVSTGGSNDSKSFLNIVKDFNNRIKNLSGAEIKKVMTYYIKSGGKPLDIF